MKFNIFALLLVGLTIGVFADKQTHAERRLNVNHEKPDEIVQYHPRFGGKNSVLLKKQKLVEEEAAADNNDDDDDDDAESSDAILSDKNKENLVGFVPVKGQNGDTYLIPQSAIETIQKEYEAAGNHDGAILVPEAVVEVVGQGVSGNSDKDSEETNVVIPKEALAGIDEDSVLALVEDGSANYLGQNILVLKNIQSAQSELLDKEANVYEGRRYSTKRRNIKRKSFNGGNKRNLNVRRFNGNKKNSGRKQIYNGQYLRNVNRKNRKGNQSRRYNANRRNIQNTNIRRYYKYLI